MFTTFQLSKRSTRGRQLVGFKETYLGGELPVFLLWRDSKAVYWQSFLAGLWTVLPQLIAIALFSIALNRVFGGKSNGTRDLVFAVGGLTPVLFSNVNVTPLRAR
jgi:ABC-type polysaccharide/polyol phosphate export permease